MNFDYPEEDFYEALDVFLDIVKKRKEPEGTVPKNIDVHTEHCCGEHKRCKYMQEETSCTVALGLRPASFPCNCDHF